MRSLLRALILSCVAIPFTGSGAHAAFTVTESKTISGLTGSAEFAGAGVNSYPLSELYSVTYTETVTVEGFVDFQAGAGGAVISYRPGVLSTLGFNGIADGGRLDYGGAASVTLSPNERAHVSYTFTYTINGAFDPSQSDIVNPFTLGHGFDDRFRFLVFNGSASAVPQGLTDAHADFAVTYTYMPAPPGAVMCLTALPGLFFIRRRLAR